MTKKEERLFIYNKFGGKCYLCGVELNGHFHVDHKEAIKRNSIYDRTKGCYVYAGSCLKPELDVLGNKNPSCSSCNINKRDFSIEAFRRLIQGFVVSLNRDSTQYKIAKRYGLIQEDIKPIKFYFETLEQ